MFDIERKSMNFILEIIIFKFSLQYSPSRLARLAELEESLTLSATVGAQTSSALPPAAHSSA